MKSAPLHCFGPRMIDERDVFLRPPPRKGPRHDRRRGSARTQHTFSRHFKDLPHGHHFAAVWAARVAPKMLPVQLAAKMGA